MRHRRLRVLLVLALAGGALVGFTVRRPILRALGSVLVADDPIAASDIIAVPVWAGEAGVLEAADLVRVGIGAKVVVVPVSPTPAEREVARRGIAYDSAAERMTALLLSLGVEAVERFPGAASGTESEGELLARWSDAYPFRSVIVVSTPDHARRLRRVLRRAMKGRPVRVSVRSARYAAFNPDGWWHTRDGVRTGLVELEKLILDLARHPFS
jgi:hypothetical protein